MIGKKPLSLMIIILALAMFGSYHIYYLVVDKANDNLVRNYERKNNEEGKIQDKTNSVIPKEEYLAILEIPKINLNEGFYSINNSKNNVNNSVTMLKESTMPDEKGSVLYLAAHSGNGYLAYFKDIDKLSIDDIMTINYQNKKYFYSINDIYESKKNGAITVNHNVNDNYLVLTTCSKTKNKQLIITSKLINQT